MQQGRNDKTRSVKTVWQKSNEMNLESQCLPHSMLLPVQIVGILNEQILFFDDPVRITENVIGCCKTTHVLLL